MSEDQLCLHWNDFQPTLTSAFADLRGEEAFVDVTLACEGRQVQAHKLVLSACSPFFRELLQRNPCRHPIVILQDVRFQDLLAIVDFVYRGEVYIRQENLNGFLQAAAQLKIYGLAKEDYYKGMKHDCEESEDADEDEPPPPPPPPQTRTPNHHWPPPKKRPRPQSPPPQTPPQNLTIQTTPPEKMETDLKMEPHDLSHMLECTLDGESQTPPETIAPQVKRESRGAGGRKRNPVLCPICSKSLSRMDHLRSHLMYIHSGMTPKALCKFCNRVFKNAESLRSHIGLYHKGRRRRQGNSGQESPTPGDTAASGNVAGVAGNMASSPSGNVAGSGTSGNTASCTSGNVAGSGNVVSSASCGNMASPGNASNSGSSGNDGNNSCSNSPNNNNASGNTSDSPDASNSVAGKAVPGRNSSGNQVSVKHEPSPQ